jgi:hypothetical protein
VLHTIAPQTSSAGEHAGAKDGRGCGYGFVGEGAAGTLFGLRILWGRYPKSLVIGIVRWCRNEEPGKSFDSEYGSRA